MTMTNTEVTHTEMSNDMLNNETLSNDTLNNDTLTSEDQVLAKRKREMQAQSEKIIDIADNEADSALKCVHLLSVAGGATGKTYKAIERRIVKDQDTYGAYHLALLSQSTPDLPVDTRQLIEMVVNYGDNDQLLSLLKNLPIPPVDAIKERIIKSEDGDAIGKMNAYLQSNPDGYGSHTTLTSGQKDRIVPLSEM